MTLALSSLPEVQRLSMHAPVIDAVHWQLQQSLETQSNHLHTQHQLELVLLITDTGHRPTAACLESMVTWTVMAVIHLVVCPACICQTLAHGHWL